ncbi:MAG: hypothetical protein PWQ17_1720, partial [Anaerophaga sp.]|nr:hypothetical protein [Anaerophaga sp.]
MRNRLYILSFFVFLISTAVGQVHYPIRTYTTVNPPAPWSLDGFVSMPGKLNLQVVVDDISLQEHPVKLRLSIKGNGIHIYTRPDYTPEPLYLDGGLTEILTGDDLSGLFNPQSLIFEGYSKNQYRHNGRLPEGVYRIGFDVLDYHRDVVISRSFPALVMMYLIQAPRLVTPRETEEIDPAMMPAVRFSWMTQGITNPLADVFYRFRIWEIRPDGRAAEEIIRSSRPLFQTETQQRFLLYDATLPALESGREYAWEVEAVDRAGEVLFKNDGKSEVSTFRYGQKCPVPSPYITGVTFNSASLRWNYDSSVGLYHILLRKEGEKQWEELTTSSATYKIPNLSEFTRYEIKVKSICDDCESDESDVVRFRTNRNVNYSCGTGSGNFDLSNRNPLPELHRFDTFKAADFLVEVESVEGGNGRFSGEGLLMVPYLNFVKFKVLFGDISINTDYQMIDGDVTFVFNEETGMVLSEDDFTKNPTQTPDYQDVDVEEALKEGTGRQVSVEGEVEDISIDGNEITVTTKDGKTQTILANADETVGISPSGGDQAYVADTSSGRVYSFPKQSSGSPGNVRSSVQSGVYGGNISFSPSKNQRYGLDDPDNGKEKPQAYFKRDKSGNLVSWKSLEAGMSDYIDMLVEGDLEADSLRYIRDSGFPVPASPVGGKKSARSLMLTGGMDGDRETLSVARSTRKTGNDSSEVLTEVGALGLATYGREDRYVKLISVHDARCPDNAGFVERELNRIYSPAIVNWHVSVGEN